MRLSGRTSSIHTDSHPINPLEDQIEDGLGPASGVFFSQKRSFAALTMVKNILDLIFSFVVFARGLPEDWIEDWIGGWVPSLHNLLIMGRGDGGRAAEESSASAALVNRDERPDLQTALAFLQQVHRLNALPRPALPLPTPRMSAGGCAAHSAAPDVHAAFLLLGGAKAAWSARHEQRRLPAGII